MNSSRLTSGRPPRCGARAWRISRLAAASAPGTCQSASAIAKFRAIEQPWLESHNRLQAGVRHQPIQPLRVDRLTGDIDVEGKTIAQLVEQSPFEGPQQRLKRPVLGQRRQSRDVMLEQCRVRVLRRQQADQQFVEVHAAEQRLAIEPVGGPGAFQAGNGLQFGLAAQFDFQRYERTNQAAGLARAARMTARSRPAE